MENVYGGKWFGDERRLDVGKAKWGREKEKSNVKMVFVCLCVCV